MSLIRQKYCARAQFSGYSSTINAQSQTGQMELCCQNLTQGTLSSLSAPFMLIGALFKWSVSFWTRPVCHSEWQNNMPLPE